MKYPKEAAVFEVVSTSLDNLFPAGSIIMAIMVVDDGDGSYLGFEARIDEPGEDYGESYNKGIFRWFLVGKRNRLAELKPLTEHARELLDYVRS